MTYQELQTTIKDNDIASVYLLCGKERFLLESILNQLIDSISPGGGESFNLERLDGAVVNLREVVNLANTLPFFAAKKLVVVDNALWFANAKGGNSNNTPDEAEDCQTTADGDDSNKNFDSGSNSKSKLEVGVDDLLVYLANPNPSTCLVFVAGEKVNRVKKVTKAVAKKGVIAEFLPLKGEAALLWLNSVLQSTNKKMSTGVKQQLLLACDYNCAIVYQELQKLVCYVGEDLEITMAAVEEITSNNTTATVFNLIDCVSVGDLAKSLSYLESVLLLEPEYMIVPILGNHFQTMLLAKNMKKRGYSNRDIMVKSGKSHPFIIEKALRQGQRYPEETLKKILEILLQADKKSKTGICSVRDALETAIIQICFLAVGR